MPKKGSSSSQKTCDPEDKRFLARINRVRVTKEEMLAYLDECNQLAPDRRGFEGNAFVAIRLHPRDPDKVSALVFRIQALARLIQAEGAHGWTLPPQPDGAVFAQDAVLAAAAAEPLVLDGKEMAFSRGAFLRSVLALAEVDTKIQ